MYFILSWSRAEIFPLIRIFESGAVKYSYIGGTAISSVGEEMGQIFGGFLM